MPEMTLSVRAGLFAFIVLMTAVVVLYHYLRDRRSLATSGALPAASAAGARAPESSDSRPRSRS